MIKLYLQNCATYSGEWLELPQDEEYIEQFIKEHKISTDEHEEYFIADTDSSDVDLYVSEYDDVFEINRFAMEYEQLEEYEQNIVIAYSEECSSFINNLMSVIDNIDSYYLVSGIDDEYDLGVHLTDGLFTQVSSVFEDYFDFEKYGHDAIISDNITLSRFGALFY